MDSRGPLYMILATLGFATLGVQVKMIDGVPSAQIVFWRSLVGVMVLLPVALRDLRTAWGVRRDALLARSVFGTASMFAYFVAIDRLPLGDAVLIAFTSPLAVATLAPWVTGERAPRGLWRALLLGLLGVGFVVEPTGRDVDPVGIAAALSTTWLAAGAYLGVRVANRTEARTTIVLWFSAFACLATLPSFAMQPASVDLPTAALLGGVGCAGLFAQLMLTKAYSLGEAPRIALYSYATPVWAYLLGIFVLEEGVRWQGVVGTCLVVVAGWYAQRITASPTDEAPS